MPPSETVAISFGNWIAAFYVVYAIAAIAVVAALAVLVDWTMGMVKRSRLATSEKSSRRARVLEPQA